MRTIRIVHIVTCHAEGEVEVDDVIVGGGALPTISNTLFLMNAAQPSL
ncbi:hypothetical protein OIV19_23110 [Brucella sp. HL-2]|nr:hypothetical protein [Brucella sp. HL-2]MCV9910457.1 hypothetical protein [Brucella sp. HL-2]